MEIRTKAARDRYMKRHGRKSVNLEVLMGTLEPLVDMIVALEKGDSNALLEAQTMKKLESQATAVRDYCQGFLYTRTVAQVDATVSKGLPAWLR